MKKLFYLFTIAAFLIAVSTACDKEDCCCRDITTNDGEGEEKTSQVRFKKEKGNTDYVSYIYRMKLTLDATPDIWNPEHYFGEANGTSDYFKIPSGIHIPVYYNRSWYNCFGNPIAYNFKAGRKYTIVGSTKGSFTSGYSNVFNIIDDGPM